MEFENTCTVPGKVNVSRAISRLFGWVYKTLRPNPVVVEYMIVVMIVRPHQDDPKLNPMGSQLLIPNL